ncbi:energy transducer TonB family protein [Frigidibacter sp. MR17.24]|uniref:energy transducer TonB family protein n=1 Tax=Frigidibacter sp. MR17.24 TaxID=3127345 RepID=UPI003012DD9E
MIGWQASLGRARRRREVAGWTAAGTLVLCTVAAGTAIAMIYDPAGTDGAERAVMIELPPLPAAQAVAEVPEAAPDVPAPDTPDLAPPAPDPEAAPDLPTPVAEAPPTPAPPPAMAPPAPRAEALPDRPEPPPPPPAAEPEVALAEVPRPPARPDAAPKVEPEPEPAPRQAERPEPQRQPARQAQERPRQQAQQAQAGARAAAGRATATEIERWTGRVQTQLARHMQRRRFAPGTVLLQLTIDAAGRVTGASVLQARGAGGLEAEILAHARRIGRVTAPPPGAPTTLRVPVQVR